MLISIRNKKGDLLVKDFLDVDFDMRIKENNEAPAGERYEVWVNSKYRYADGFATKKDAEDQMVQLASTRNDLENELRDLI